MIKNTIIANSTFFKIFLIFLVLITIFSLLLAACAPDGSGLAGGSGGGNDNKGGGNDNKGGGNDNKGGGNDSIAGGNNPSANHVVFSYPTIQMSTDGGSGKPIHVELSTPSIGEGKLEISFPETIKLGEEKRIKLTIAPITMEIEFEEQTSSTKNNVVHGDIAIYPLMSAELIAGNSFDIYTEGSNEKIFTTNQSATWIWFIKPTSGG